MSKIYQTRYFGGPYGLDGSDGEDTTAPLRTARETLQPGQRMDAYYQGRLVKRFVCDSSQPGGHVSEVEVDSGAWEAMVRQARADLGMTHADFGEALAVGERVVRYWEAGIGQPTPRRQAAMLDALKRLGWKPKG